MSRLNGFLIYQKAFLNRLRKEYLIDGKNKLIVIMRLFYYNKSCEAGSKLLYNVNMTNGLKNFEKLK